jgi:hypothetical protein
MSYQLVVYPVLVGLSLGYSFWIRKRASQALDRAGPAFTDFFERTGYRYIDMRHVSAAAQAERALADGRAGKGGSDVHYVRDYEGLAIHYTMSFGQHKQDLRTVYYRTNQWHAEIPAPPRVSLHIADKSLQSTMKQVTELVSREKRVFTPKCAQQITTGIAEIDRKFVVFADNPEAARAVLVQNPALVAMLLAGWAELDVWVTRDGATFADPGQANMQAAMGGTIGNMATGFDHAKRLDLTTPVHERVADLLATLVRATA